MEGIDEVNFLEAKDKNRVLIKVGGSISRVIGRKGVGIRLIKHILEIEFGIEDPNISILESQRNE
jgi:ribosomal protein S3